MPKGRFMVTSEPEGAEVVETLTGTQLGATNTEWIVWDNGSVCIDAELDGYKPMQKAFTLDPHIPYKCHFKLVPKAGTKASPKKGATKKAPAKKGAAKKAPATKGAAKKAPAKKGKKAPKG